MKEVFKQMKITMILSALLCVAFGVVFLFWPVETVNLFSRLIGCGLLLLGVFQIVSYVSDHVMNPFSGGLGLIEALVGIWIFFQPTSIVKLIPIVIGVVLIVHGFQDIALAFETRQNAYEKWWTMLLIAAASIILGVICIVNAFGLVKLAIQFIGVALIFDGLSDLWVASRAIRAARNYQKEQDALVAEYKEVDNGDGSGDGK